MPRPAAKSYSVPSSRATLFTHITNDINGSITLDDPGRFRVESQTSGGASGTTGQAGRTRHNRPAHNRRGRVGHGHLNDDQ